MRKKQKKHVLQQKLHKKLAYFYFFLYFCSVFCGKVLKKSFSNKEQNI